MSYKSIFWNTIIKSEGILRLVMDVIFDTATLAIIES